MYYLRYAVYTAICTLLVVAAAILIVLLGFTSWVAEKVGATPLVLMTERGLDLVINRSDATMQALWAWVEG